MSTNEPTGETMEEGSAEGNPTTEVSPEFQKAASELVANCTDTAELDYLDSLVQSQQKKLQSSQKKSGESTNMFSTDDMPKGD